jgi:glutamine synthetase
MNDRIKLNPNKLVQYLSKEPADFNKNDIIKFIEGNNIKMINFRYIGGDGRLKVLNFIISSKEHLDLILSKGERVDGSSLFNYIEADSSDLYVIPRLKTAFVNPFTEVASVDIMCSYYTKDGRPLESSPENIVKKANNILKRKTGYTFEAMGELEFYFFSEVDAIYPIEKQKGYHESHPFSKWAFIRKEAMRFISEIGCNIKYGHSEVGNIIDGDLEMVQHEIEFLPAPIDEAADQLVLAKWAIRETAYKYGLEVSFAPKIMVGQAGSGLHIHSRLLKDNKNAMINQTGLSDVARKVIAGHLMLAPSLTAFGNTVPTSFLRLVPHQEAPTSISWGDRNRSVLIRVPLGWQNTGDMFRNCNPNEPENSQKYIHNQTIEFRSPDGSANLHQLLAGLCVGALYGLEHKDSLDVAEKLYISTDASSVKGLNQLPASCFEAAERLLEQRDIYEKDGVFPSEMIERLAAKLKSYNDKNLSEQMYGNADALKQLVAKHLHCG